MHSLEDRVFRLSPRYEVRLWEDLPEHQRAMLGQLRKRGYKAILLPRAGTLATAKAVCTETHNLLMRLVVPCHLPPSAFETSGSGAPGFLTLLAGGLIELRDEGEFVWGPEAVRRIQAGAPDASPPVTISERAIFYAQKLRVDDPVTLSSRLYFFNRRPATPRLLTRFPDRRAVDTFLGLEPGAPTSSTLRRLGWHRAGVEDGFAAHWQVWRANRVRSSGAALKLYVAMPFEHLPGALPDLLVQAERHGAYAAKFPTSPWSMLRPDHLLLYFRDERSLARSEANLGVQLDEFGERAAVQPHEVPFAAPSTASRFLYWGVDGAGAGEVPWLEKESSRLALTNRLAVALIDARHSAVAEPWRDALVRLRCDGVNTDTWTTGPFPGLK